MGQFIGLVLPLATLLAWFAGATALQARGRRSPVDIILLTALTAAVLAVYHLVAYLEIAAAKQSGSIPVLLLDLGVVLTALVVVRRRVRAAPGYFKLFILVILSSLTFFGWYIGTIGGLGPG